MKVDSNNGAVGLSSALWNLGTLKNTTGARAWQLRASQVALLEDLGSIQFKPQCSHRGLKPSVTQVPWHPTHRPGLYRTPGTHMIHRHTSRQNTHRHQANKQKKVWKTDAVHWPNHKTVWNRGCPWLWLGITKNPRTAIKGVCTYQDPSSHPPYNYTQVC